MTHRIRSKHHPPRDKDKYAVQMMHDGKTVVFMPSRQFFNDNENPVPQSPADEIPAGAVPNPRHQKHSQQIEQIASFRYTVAAQWNVQVFFEPSGQTDVPAAPKFRD